MKYSVIGFYRDMDHPGDVHHFNTLDETIAHITELLNGDCVYVHIDHQENLDQDRCATMA